jgi:hypothetical protein
MAKKIIDPVAYEHIFEPFFQEAGVVIWSNPDCKLSNKEIELLIYFTIFAFTLPGKELFTKKELAWATSYLRNKYNNN